MLVALRFCIYFLYILCYVQCGYPPQGDEVQTGSVLLPATRRGRYLANIVRRQAVDGTGIKFNKDADRMNAEAKKKVDVLSEELLPYIIAEQERRTTLYKRVMTAIQNGEKGVTIAEIRNKPPLIIRKGLMYRCPSNRSPKEPDGSGVIMCESELEPTPIMYDSCLSAEDKELYVADSRYFFCNRHKVEGPDLPRNGTTVIGCAPLERTSLNYTTGKCALEDTDDVVVHYRYYPDKTYKFVTELDPDHEVCDHWNPCQIGYIYSLPSPDQAMPANELWRDYGPDEYEKDEIVPPIPEDNPEEYVPDSAKEHYKTSPRKIEIPDGFKFHGIGRYSLQNIRTRITVVDKVLKNYTNIKISMRPPPARRRSDGTTPAEVSPAPVALAFFSIQLIFSPLTPEDMTTYYVRFESSSQPGQYKYRTIVVLHQATVPIKPQSVDILPGQEMQLIRIPLKCGKCTLRSLMVRAFDGGIANLGRSRYRIRTEGERKYIEIDIGMSKFADFGDYFMVVQTEDGNEERVKILSVQGSDITCQRQTSSVEVGTHVDNTVKYECSDCSMEDVVCEGKSVLNSGRVSIVTASKFVSFNFPSFENENSCVYIGIFRIGDVIYKKLMQVIDNASPVVNIEKQEVNPPAEGTQFEMELPYQCQGDCSIDKVTLNGVPLEAASRRVATVGVAFYVYTPTELSIRITYFSSFYLGIYQATFSTAAGMITKTVMEIKDPNEPSSEAMETTAAAAAATEVASDAATVGASEAASEASAPLEGGKTTPPPAEAESNATPAIESPAPAEGEDTKAPEAPADAAAEEPTTEAPA